MTSLPSGHGQFAVRKGACEYDKTSSVFRYLKV